MPENDVAALLPIYLISEAPKRSDCLTARNTRKDTHTATSMTSSWIDGDRLVPLAQALDVALDGLADIPKRLVSSGALGDAAGKRRNRCHEYTVFVRLDDDAKLHENLLRLRRDAPAYSDLQRAPTLHRARVLFRAVQRLVHQLTPRAQRPPTGGPTRGRPGGPSRTAAGPSAVARAAAGQLHTLVVQHSGWKVRAGRSGRRTTFSREPLACGPASPARFAQAGAQCSLHHRRPPPASAMPAEPAPPAPSEAMYPPCPGRPKRLCPHGGAPSRPDQRWAERTENRSGSSDVQHRRTPRAHSRDQIASSSPSEEITSAV